MRDITIYNGTQVTMMSIFLDNVHFFLQKVIYLSPMKQSKSISEAVQFTITT
jgi:hypothetical protein